MASLTQGMKSAGASLIQGPKPVLDVIALAAVLGDALAELRIGHDEEALALAEARTRCTLGRQPDALEHGAIERLGREVAHHPPTCNDLPEIHRSPPASSWPSPRA